MIIKGLQLIFNCKNGEQYESIGMFWDEMSRLYGRENLLGTGYGWQNDTLCYMISHKKADFDIIPPEIMKLFPKVRLTELVLPDKGWICYSGMTEKLDGLYEEIYKHGKLKYETESFFNDGRCEINVIPCSE